MFNFLYNFGFSSQYNLGLGPVVQLGAVSQGSMTHISREADLLFTDVNGVKGLASAAAQPVNSPDLKELVRKMHAVGGFDSEKMPDGCSLLTLENGELCAFERSAAKGGLPKPKRSTKVKLFNVDDGNMFVVFQHKGEVKIAQLYEDHLFNALFQPSLHLNAQPGMFHRAYEFKMHLDEFNHPTLLDPYLLETHVEMACLCLAAEVWAGQDPKVMIEPCPPKYGGYGFEIIIMSEDPETISDLCFPTESLKKLLPAVAGMPGASASLEVFNVTVV